MVQMKVFTKGMNIEEQAQELRQQIGALKYRTLVSMAETIAQTSPVDSGTYARNHEVGLRSGSFTANVVRDPNAPRRSKGQPVDVQGARDAGLQGMMDDINSFGLLNAAGGIRSLADPDQSNFVFRNPVEYASAVEARDAVYSRTRREVGNAISDAVSAVRRR
jgi:hypothetical protein